MLLIVLQNAYGVEDGYVPSYDRDSFKNSHTGRRLRRAIPEGLPQKIVNSNPTVGDHVDSCYPPDPDYVEGWIKTIQPTVILACGAIAKKTMGLVETDVHTLFMPHPAYRALTNATLDNIHNTLKDIL